MMDIGIIETVAQAANVAWPTNMLDYKFREAVTPAVVVELTALIRRQEAELAEARASLPAAGAVLTDTQINHIGEQWDGCIYDSDMGLVDIGAAIRTELKKFQPAAAAPDAQADLHAAIMRIEVDNAAACKTNNAHAYKIGHRDARHAAAALAAAQPEAKAAPTMGEEVLPTHLRSELSNDEQRALAAMVGAEAKAMGEELPPLPDDVAQIVAELEQAKSIWPPFNSAHEGFAVLAEEVDELWDEVKVNQKRRDLPKMYKEAKQVAAMALRFMRECCDEVTGRK